MQIRHHHDGRIYHIELPEGTRVHRSKITGESHLIFEAKGKRNRYVFEEPSEIIVRCAESGLYGMRLVAITEVKAAQARTPGEQ